MNNKIKENKSISDSIRNKLANGQRQLDRELGKDGKEFMRKVVYIFLLIACVFHTAHARSVFKCVQQGGTISYQDRPCQNEAETMLTKRGIVDEESYVNSLKQYSGDLGDKRVTMLVFDWWEAFQNEIDERVLHFKFTDDEGDTPISLLIDFIVPSSKEALTDKEIRKIFQEKARTFLDTSVETQLLAQKMKTNNGFGYYQTFTDKNLVGKSSYPAGQYLYSTSGLMTHGDVMVNFTLLSNDYTAQNHIFAMTFLGEGLMIQEGKASDADTINLSDSKQDSVTQSSPNNSEFNGLIDAELPEPPVGFTWAKMPEAMAAILKPDGWHEINKTTDDAVTYAISKEKASESKNFETGLTLMAIKDLRSKMGVEPMTFALAMGKEIEDSEENTVIRVKGNTGEMVSSFIIQYENHPQGKEPVIIQKVMAANKVTGSLYMILFEAPKDEWDEAWKIGEIMMQRLFLDDEF